MFWPAELLEDAAKLSVIPILLRTQDEFIAILSVPVADLRNLFRIVNASTFSGNLFVKHLALLADFGGEQFQRINSNFGTLFKDRQLEYLWNGQQHTYSFQALPVAHLTNDRLGISNQKLLKARKLDKLLQDVTAILIFGNACTNETTAGVLSKCEIGDYLGQGERLEQFIRQRYIWVSRITMGSRSNNLGQLAQRFVLEYVEQELGISRCDISSQWSYTWYYTHRQPG